MATITKALFSLLLLQYALCVDDDVITTTPALLVCNAGAGTTRTLTAAQSLTLMDGLVPANSSCRYFINPPAGSYIVAQVSIENAQVGDLIIVGNTDHDNDVVVGNGTNATNVAYPPTSIYITVNTGKKTQPHIRITLTAKEVPTAFADSVERTTQVNQQAFKILLSDLKKPQAKTIKIVAVNQDADPAAVPPKAEIKSGNIVLTTLAVGSNDKTSWMNVFLFDKNSYLCTLADVLNKNGGKYDQQEVLYVFQANPDGVDSSNLISINNAQNLAQYPGSEEIIISGNKKTVHLLVASADTPAVLSVSMESLTCLTNVTFTDATSTLKLFAGEPVSEETDYSLAEYKAADVASQLPQAIYATSVSFILDKKKGNATLTFGNCTTAGWQLMRPGRKGFFSTQNYLLLQGVDTANYNRLALLSNDENSTLYTIVVGQPKGNKAATCRYSVLGENKISIDSGRDICKPVNYTGSFFELSMSPGVKDATDPLGAFIPFSIQKAVPPAPVTPGPGETEGTTTPYVPDRVLDCRGERSIQTDVDWEKYQFAASSNCYIPFDFTTPATAMRITLRAQGISNAEFFQLEYGYDNKQIIKPDANGILNVDITWSQTDNVVLRVLTSAITNNIFWLQTSDIPIDLTKNAMPYPLKAGANGVFILDQTNDFIPGRACVFTSDTGVTLGAAFDPDAALAAQATSLFLYEKNGDNQVFKGSVLSLLASKTFSSTKQVTIYMAHPVKMTSPTQVIANDNANLKAYASYSVMWPQQVDLQSINLNANGGASAWTFADTKDLHRSFIMSNIKFSSNNQTLTVSAGPPTTESKTLYSFSSKDSTVYSDDMSFPGYVKTISLDRGSVSFDLVSNTNSLLWSTPTREGRKGVIMTPNYPVGASSGDYIVEFTNDGNKQYRYIYKVETADTDSTMSVSFWNGDKWGDWATADVKSKEYSYYKGMRLKLNGGSRNTSAGIYMTFEHRSAAALVPTIVLFLMAFYA